ncbi:MAG TPA: branched-chain amino acid ABC transporter substrate-binding protein [Solirubrobacteraceae bacterium]|jgi:branched-chain amino acid transport system substrate-binding protein|nr:branched-chain amino acid ABC transporter substrate-binding protein [Solirubrobacteraceae bacterium]
MKVRLTLAAVALTALVAAGCGSSSNSSSSSSGGSSAAASASSSSSGSGKSCKATIAIEGPFTGPVAQVGLEQLHFAQLAVANDNKSLGTNVTLAQDDTQLTPSLATQKTQSIIATSAVAALGPAGSQEVEAVGPLFGRAGMAFISGSATLPKLTTSGANPTFLRVVPNDNIQGPQDANYVINHLHPKGVLIIDDNEAYSQGLVNTMIPIFQKAGIKVNHQTLNGTDTGATLANAINSLVTSQLNPSETVTMLPWQAAANAQQFGLAVQQQHKTTTLFGTDGTNSPSQFKIPGTYVSNFGPDPSQSNTPLDKQLVAGVAQYGPYGSFGVPTYTAADVEMKAIAAVCKAGQTPNRSNVLAAIRKTNIPPNMTPLGATVAFKSNGDLIGQPGYLFKISSSGKYMAIPNH